VRFPPKHQAADVVDLDSGTAPVKAYHVVEGARWPGRAPRRCVSKTSRLQRCSLYDGLTIARWALPRTQLPDEGQLGRSHRSPVVADHRPHRAAGRGSRLGRGLSPARHAYADAGADAVLSGADKDRSRGVLTLPGNGAPETPVSSAPQTPEADTKEGIISRSGISHKMFANQGLRAAHRVDRSFGFSRSRVREAGRQRTISLVAAGRGAGGRSEGGGIWRNARGRDRTGTPAH